MSNSRSIRNAALNALAESDLSRSAYGLIDSHLGIIKDVTNNRYLWPVWHRACDELAFFMTEDPRYTDIKSTNSVNPDNGEHFEANSAMICYSCGKTMRPCDILAMPVPRTKVISLATH